jgi:hypothetical protein
MKCPFIFLLLWGVFLTTSTFWAEEARPPSEIAAQAIKAVGGEAKVLRLFRIKERFNMGPTLVAPDVAKTRVSIIEAPRYWWLNGKDRTDEPAKFDVWGWSLGVLTDPATVLSELPGVEENGVTTVGLRVSGTIEPAMDLHFDPATWRLVRMDWSNDIYRFSEWREQDGTGYQSKTIMLKRKTLEPWFYHEILELEPLTELPAGLVRE